MGIGEGTDFPRFLEALLSAQGGVFFDPYYGKGRRARNPFRAKVGDLSALFAHWEWVKV